MLQPIPARRKRLSRIPGQTPGLGQQAVLGSQGMQPSGTAPGVPGGVPTPGAFSPPTTPAIPSMGMAQTAMTPPAPPISPGTPGSMTAPGAPTTGQGAMQRLQAQTIARKRAQAMLQNRMGGMNPLIQGVGV